MAKQIICADAIAWLESGACPPCAIVTSPPEAAELKMSIAEFAPWYQRAIELCIAAAGPGAPVIIYSTDRKADGGWLSKPALIIAAAQASGFRLLWHKIVLRREPGHIDIHRPGFTNLVAIGGADCRPGAATPDVMHRGHMLYPDAMGFIPARLAIEFAASAGLPIVDPFCGRGTVPAIADALGLETIGIDIDAEQCAHAQSLTLQEQRKRAG